MKADKVKADPIRMIEGMMEGVDDAFAELTGTRLVQMPVALVEALEAASLITVVNGRRQLGAVPEKPE